MKNTATSTIDFITERRNGIREWLDETAPYTASDQKHLDSATPEQAYWHFGYQAALTDVLALFQPSVARDSTDIQN